MMIHEFTRRAAAIAILSLAVGITAAAPAHAADAIPAKPEAGTFKLGIEPWLGYGQWHIAAKKGLFKQGLSDVQIVNFTDDNDINAALASGQLDAANIATHTAMGLVAAGLPVKIVTLLDVSIDRRRDFRRQGHPPSRTSRASRSPSRKARPATSS